jgi:hypothetical protein
MNAGGGPVFAIDFEKEPEWVRKKSEPDRLSLSLALIDLSGETERKNATIRDKATQGDEAAIQSGKEERWEARQNRPPATIAPWSSEIRLRVPCGYWQFAPLPHEGTRLHGAFHGPVTLVRPWAASLQRGGSFRRPTTRRPQTRMWVALCRCSRVRSPAPCWSCGTVPPTPRCQAVPDVVAHGGATRSHLARVPASAPAVTPHEGVWKRLTRVAHAGCVLSGFLFRS